MVEEKANIKANQTIDSRKIREILSANKGALLRAWRSICSGCGLCAEGCFYYLSHGRDPKLSPAYKINSTLGEMYRRKGNVGEAFLEKCYETLWLKCTMCRRCSLYCPFGIDIAAMMMIARNVCFSQGVTPETLVEFTDNCRKTGNHMGLPPQELIDVCEWMAEEAEDSYNDVAVPIDKPGAEYMYTINPREAVFYPQDIGNAAIIFAIAQESWTIPTSGWDCTNIPMLAGDRDLAGQMVKSVYDKALELGAKKILTTECGHAYVSLAFLGPYWTGYADGKPPLEIVHYVQWLYECLENGRIRIDPAKRVKEPITYQDPCSVSRNGGLFEEARGIINYIAEDFREMTPNREHNHCCGGGGGLIPMGKDYKSSRLDSGRIKAEQIKSTGAKIVVTSCHNCFDQINDLDEKYELGIKAVSFKDLILETMIVPDRFKPE